MTGSRSMKLVMGILVTLLLLTGLGINYATGVDGPKTKELSLSEAVYLAIKTNPDMELADLAVKKAEAEYDGAKEAAKPLKIEMVQNFELGKVKWYYPKATEVGLTMAKKKRELAEKSLKLSVEKAYYNVLKAEKSLEVKRESLNYLQDQLKIAQTAYKVGTKAKVDVTTLEAGLAGVQAQVTLDENNLRAAVMELNRLTGLDLDTPLKLTSRFEVEKVGNSIKVEEVIKKALEDNIEILGQKKDLEAKQALYDVTKKFYGGGVTAYDTAAIDTKMAAANVRKQEVLTTSVVKQSYLRLFTLERMIQWQTKEVEKAEEILRIYNLKYKTGLATSLDVKNATIDLEKAKEGLAGTIYDYNLLKSQFKYELFSSAAGSGGMAS